MTVTLPVSIFVQQHLLSVPVGSKDSHENVGVSAAAFDVSSHNCDFVEDLVRVGNNQKASFKHLSLTHAKQAFLSEKIATQLLDSPPHHCFQRQSWRWKLTPGLSIYELFSTDLLSLERDTFIVTTSESQNHWMDWVERDLYSSSCSTLWHRQEHLPLSQADPIPVQPVRNGAATDSLRKLCQGLIALSVKKFFLLSNPSQFSLNPLSLVVLQHHWWRCLKLVLHRRHNHHINSWVSNLPLPASLCSHFQHSSSILHQTLAKLKKKKTKNVSQKNNCFFFLAAKCFPQKFSVHLGNVYSNITNSLEMCTSESPCATKISQSCSPRGCSLLHQVQTPPRSRTLKACQFVKIWGF